MKFQYLGTAAAEGFPGLFCTCEICDKARKAGGRNIRTRSQAIIDDKLLIDFPPDTYLHVLNYGLDLTKVYHCILTHCHSDHLYTEELEMRDSAFAHMAEGTPPLTMYSTGLSSQSILNIIEKRDLEKKGRVAFQEIAPFVPFPVDKYTITPLKAEHDKRIDPVIYIINDGQKAVLYGNDTGYFVEETWEYLEKNKPYLNMVSLDCTFGSQKSRLNHMGIEANAEVKDRLLAIGCADENTIFIAHHYSHNGLETYDDMIPIAEKYGFLVSYDSMVIEL